MEQNMDACVETELQYGLMGFRVSLGFRFWSVRLWVWDSGQCSWLQIGGRNGSSRCGI